MDELTKTHKEIINDLIVDFINIGEMPNRKEFRVTHFKYLNDIDYLEKIQVLPSDIDKYKLPLGFFKEWNGWQKEKIFANKILKILRGIYMNNPHANFTLETIIPKDEIEFRRLAVKRALYYLRETGFISGYSQDSNGNYTSISPHENVLRCDDIDEKINPVGKVIVREELPSRDEKNPLENSDRQKNWRNIKGLGEGGQGKVFLVEKLNYHNEVVNEVVTSIKKVVATEEAEIINKVAYDLPLFFSKFANDLRNNTHRGALKQLHASGSADYRKALERMEKEVTGMEKISHPNIVKILDKNLDAGWFVMEYFEHGPLDRHLHIFRGNVLKSLYAFRKLVKGVAEMHSQKLIHRDIKPQNIYLRSPKELVVGDLGLIFTDEDDTTRVSETYENVGSRDWMPGWAQGKKLELISPAFDVFCLAKVLWAMISGKTKMQLWYYDHDDSNLEKLFPDKEEMPAVNNLLSKCIVQFEKDIKIKNATELLNEINKVIIKVKVQRLAGNDTRKCLVCGNGNYQRIANGESKITQNFGLNPITNSGFKIYRCNGCGHVQLFNFRNTNDPKELPEWENDSIKDNNSNLRSKLANKESLVYDKGADAYYKQIADGEKEGPFCKTCWDIDSKLLWLNQEGWCAGCKQGYGTAFHGETYLS